MYGTNSCLVPVNKLQKYLKLVSQNLGTLQFPSPHGFGFQVKKLVVTNLKVGKKFFISLLGLFSPEPPIPLHFFPVSHWFRGWLKINLKVYDIINCLYKNLITHFVWYLEREKRCGIETLSIYRVLNNEHFYGKIMQKICTKSWSQTPF